MKFAPLAAVSLFTLVAITAVQAPAAGAAPAQLTEAQAAAEIMAADNLFSKVTGEKRLEGFMSFLSDSVMTLAPDTAVIRGKDGLRKVWAGLDKPTFHVVWHPLYAYASSCGDLGYSVGVAEFWKDVAGAKQPLGSSKYLTVWRRQADGSWKVVFDTGVEDSAPKK